MVLGAGSQQKRQAAGGFGGGLNALHREREVVDRPRRIPSRILDGANDQPRCAGQSDGLGTGFWRNAETILKIGGNR